MRLPRHVCPVAFVTACLLALSAEAQSRSGRDFFQPVTNGDGIRYPMVLAPVIWEVLNSTVQAVPGSDGRIHVAYVARFTNQSRSPLTLDSIEVVDPARGNRPTGINRALSILDEDVTGQLLLFSLPPTLDKANYARRLEAGQSAAVYFDVTYPDRGEVPRFLSHRVTVSQTDAQNETQTYTVVDPPVRVLRADPIVLRAPLRGDRWLDGNGCCLQVGPHRWVLTPINGAIQPAEMFAIDFVQLDAQGRGYSGDIANVRSYPYYGADVLAAESGTVVEVVRDLPDSVPGQNPPNATAATAAGNHVIVDMGAGHYALYAHLAPNSPVVQVGDYVQQGQRLGALGNSGNSDAPHLHFQVMDRPSALGATGLPFVFENMQLQGRTTGSLGQVSDQFSRGAALPIDVSRIGDLQRVMPLSRDVLGFR